MEKNINFIVKEDEKNLRVDVLINKREELISRTRIKNLILKEKLTLNNEIIKSPSKKVSIGDTINLKIPEPEIASLKPYEFKLEIIYEDNDLLVINKPAGIIMHPGAGNYDKTIVNALMHYDKDSLSNIGDELRPGIVHRIDKNTSGLVVIAKNNETHENLSKQFSDHTIIREYQLLIWGKLRPSSGRIETFITRSSKNRQLMEVSSSKGKKAITNYKTLEIFENQKPLSQPCQLCGVKGKVYRVFDSNGFQHEMINNFRKRAGSEWNDRLKTIKGNSGRDNIIDTY